MDGGPQTWYERLPKEEVLWQDGPVLAVKQNLEGHGETFCLIICHMNIKVNTPGYNNELNEVHVNNI